MIEYYLLEIFLFVFWKKVWFNRLSSFVTTEVVKNFNKKKRIEVINYFILVAFDCFELGNFNSAMAIIGIFIEKRFF